MRVQSARFEPKQCACWMYVCVFNNNVRVDLLEEVRVKKICIYTIKRCVYMYLRVCACVLLRRARVCFVCFDPLRHHHLSRCPHAQTAQSQSSNQWDLPRTARPPPDTAPSRNGRCIFDLHDMASRWFVKTLVSFAFLISPWTFKRLEFLLFHNHFSTIPTRTVPCLTSHPHPPVLSAQHHHHLRTRFLQENG